MVKDLDYYIKFTWWWRISFKALYNAFSVSFDMLLKSNITMNFHFIVMVIPHPFAHLNFT